ncbi:ABC transporter ATP-binding protein, partial [Halobacteriales archaeon QH_10_70_21]
VAGFIGSPSMNFIEGEITADGFESRYLDLEFDSADQGVERGQAVTLGVRPEDVHLERNSEQAAVPTGTYGRIVDVLEPMGNEMNVYLLSDENVEASAEGRGEGQTLMNVGPEEVLGEGENVEVVFDRDKIHLFDTDSGQAVIHGLE